VLKDTPNIPKTPIALGSPVFGVEVFVEGLFLFSTLFSVLFSTLLSVFVSSFILLFSPLNSTYCTNIPLKL